MGEMHFNDKVAFTPSVAIIRMAEAVKDRELRHLDVEQTFTRANAEEEIHIELPEEYHGLPGRIRKTKKIHERTTSTIDMQGQEADQLTWRKCYGQLKIDPRILMKDANEAAVVVEVVHASNILVSTIGKKMTSISWQK